MPLVSIWITTYNHEKFIAEAIDSILMQKVDFSYEIVIGEDCSTDSTRSIVIAYKEKYPDKIRLFLPEQNLGMAPMFKASYNLCDGRYIAWLDGDDFWIDDSKLQKQVDFLESHPDFVMCFHNIKFLDQGNNIEFNHSGDIFMNSDGTLSVEHLLHVNNQVFALSVVHRNVLGSELPDWIYTVPYLDLPFYLLLAENGKIKYFSEIMGVYRVHKGGSYSGQSAKLQCTQKIELFKYINIHLTNIPKKMLNRNIGFHYYEILKIELEEGNYRTAWNYFIILTNYDLSFLNKRKKEIIMLFFNALTFNKVKHLFS